MAELTLTQSPEAQTPGPSSPNGQGNHINGFAIYSEDYRDPQPSNRMRNTADSKKGNLHPYVQTLSVQDLESCVALENAAFPEQKRYSRETLEYLLTTCPELCLGLFSSTKISPSAETEPSHKAAQVPDSSTPSHRAILLAHVIATQSDSPTITDVNMDIPSSFRSHPNHTGRQDASTSISGSSPPSDTKPLVPAKDAPPVPPKDNIPARGHVPNGHTLAIHSLAVLPTHQNRLLGRTIIKSYLQRMESAGLADGAVLIAPPKLVNWFARVGFRDSGPSQTNLGSGEWRAMVCGFSVMMLPKPSKVRLVPGLFMGFAE
ncbi:MAG: hypothetical protein Q9187_007126 [Circinaria calcarea]